jgi:TonB family protein
MTQIETLILAYLLNSLWQVPLVFCAAWVASLMARRVGPHMEHSVWVGALLLQVTLPLCHFPLADLAWRLVLWFQNGGAGNGQTRVFVGPGIADTGGMSWLTAGVLASLAFVYLSCVVFFALRLAWAWIRTESVSRRAKPVELSAGMLQIVERSARQFGLDRSRIEVASTPAIAGPATVGILEHTLLLPSCFFSDLEARDLDALLAHEFAHMQRKDFALNLLYGIVSLPVAYHPLLWLTRARLAETREMACDAMAADVAGGREPYARSLLRLAAMLARTTQPKFLHAIGFLDANIFERRIMQLTRTKLEVGLFRRSLIAAACALLAIGTCASAVALRMDVETPSGGNSNPARVHVKVDDLKITKKVQPVYPEKAKKAKIRGSVQLDVIIGKDGTVENIKVSKSVNNDLDQSAMDAVRQWVYEPYLLNGDPIEVETTVTVIYSLAG